MLTLSAVAGLNIKLDLTLGAHAHQQLLQGVGALVAGVEPLLQRIEGTGLSRAASTSSSLVMLILHHLSSSILPIV